jgi:DNA polymerase-3 subunit beta
MKFNVASKALQQQLQAVSKVINAKNAVSIFDNFLLKVEGGVLSITGSDQENTMTATIDVMDNDMDGAIAIPAKRLLEVLKEVPEQGLTFYVNEETLEIDIRFLNGHFNFVGVNADEFPQKSADEANVTTIKVASSVVRKGIDATLYAVSTDTLRAIMTGIYWDIHPEDITFVSSDTHKLVRYVSTVCAPGVTTSFIMPPKPSAILKGLIGKDDGEVEINIDEKGATFMFGNYKLSCRFINGVYPPYNRVIPTDNPFELTVDRVSMLNAVRRVALFASLSTSMVKFTIEPGEVLLSSKDPDYGTSAEERLTCEYSGNSISVGFNSVHMVEALSNLDCESVILKLSDPSRPGVLVPQVSKEGEDVLVLMMPLQLLEY